MTGPDRCPVCGTLDPEMSFANDEGQLLQNFIMERMIGRPLAAGEIVHFRDGDWHNCQRSNLVLCSPATRMDRA